MEKGKRKLFFRPYPERKRGVRIPFLSIEKKGEESPFAEVASLPPSFSDKLLKGKKFSAAAAPKWEKSPLIRFPYFSPLRSP